jgi:hypothetical protein
MCKYLLFTILLKYSDNSEFLRERERECVCVCVVFAYNKVYFCVFCTWNKKILLQILFYIIL